MDGIPRRGRSRSSGRLGWALAAVVLAATAAACGGHGPAAPVRSTTGSTPRATTPAATPTAASAQPTPTPAPAAPGIWHPVFTDDFDGTALAPDRWTTCYDWNLGGCTNAGNDEIQWYLPGQVAVGGGQLNLSAVRRPTTGSDGVTYPWRSGMVSTGRDSWEGTPRHVFSYGYFAARIKVPAGAGFFPAFWLMPQTRATPPELDVVEFIGGTRSVVMTVHWTGPDGEDLHQGRHFSGSLDYSAGYHVFALDWEKNSLTWFVDGVSRLVVTQHVPAVPM
jgi:beta-glucanase (GH16 family)